MTLRRLVRFHMQGRLEAVMNVDQEALAALDAGIAEANRRTNGDFDGLLGSLHGPGSELLADLVAELRDVLLDKYSDETARALISEYEPTIGYRNVTVVPDDVELALRLLNLVASAMRCDPARRAELLLGKRDAARQAGTRKERRPEISRWIEDRLRRNPEAKAPELWAAAPDWITDTIGRDRFSKRVTKARKVGRK